jgi:peptidoglycan/LPS O-acetylase OafA/YrhL
MQVAGLRLPASTASTWRASRRPTWSYYGHLVWGGTFSTEGEYRAWMKPAEELPLLKQAEQSVWLLDFVLQPFDTGLAMIGVGLFFLISGWLMPPMLRRYSRTRFVVNRSFRIFPMLVCAVLLAAAIQLGAGNSDALHWEGVFSTAFLVSQFFGLPLSLGVVWTLAVEFKFYLALAALGVLSQKKVLLASFSLLMCTLVYAIAGHKNADFEQVFLHDAYFMLFMLIGCSLRLAADAGTPVPAWRRFSPPLAAAVLFGLNRSAFLAHVETPPLQDLNVATQIGIFFLFGVSVWWQATKRISRRVADLIEQCSNVTYSVYLLHLSVGTYLIVLFRKSVPDQYVLLAIVISLLSALSALTYQYIETPFNAYARRRLLGRA